MTVENAALPALMPRIRRQLVELARLAGPTVISRAGILTMVLVDVAMVTRFSTVELAYASLGASLFVPLLVIGVGLMTGVLARTAQEFGAGNEAKCAEIWYRALPFAAWVGAISAVILLFGESLLTLFGQEPELAREGGRVAWALAPGLIGYAFFVASTFFLEGLQRPWPGMIAMLIANVLNMALNWVFIFGNLGMPAMGAVGSGITTSLVRIFLGVALVWYILRLRDGERFGLHGLPGRRALAGWWTESEQARKIGYAGGVSIGSETVSHSTLLQFAGLLGVLPIAAYTVATNVEAVMFMVGLGIGAATSVLVANAWGRGDVSGARLAGWTGFCTNLVVMSVFGLAIYLGREPLAWFYSPDPDLVAASMPLLAFVGIVIVADGAQLTLAQAVRGLGDTWPATWRALVAFFGVMIPSGWWFGIEQGWGASGLLFAMMLSYLVSMILQGQRFMAILAAAEREEAGR